MALVKGDHIVFGQGFPSNALRDFGQRPTNDSAWISFASFTCDDYTSLMGKSPAVRENSPPQNPSSEHPPTLRRVGGYAQSLWASVPQSVRNLLVPAFVAIAYYLGALAAFTIGTLTDRIFAPFWPPNVVLFCA